MFKSFINAYLDEGLQGYHLSCVIDEPNRRTTGLNSKESNVHLVCQKAEGHKQAEEIHYQIANCVIEMKYHIKSTSAAMDNLKPLLSNYLTRVSREEELNFRFNQC